MLNILLQAQEKGAGGPNMLLMMGLMFVVIYFFMIRPQSKRQKEERKFREEIQKGLKIVTTGGIHGKIVELKDSVLIIETEGGNRLKIEKTAISKELSAHHYGPKKDEKSKK